MPSVGWHLSTFEYAGTNFHKQNSAFLDFYESGSGRLLRVSGVGLLYLFQLLIPNLSCGQKHKHKHKQQFSVKYYLKNMLIF
jgi:hypothetical protein